MKWRMLSLQKARTLADHMSRVSHNYPFLRIGTREARRPRSRERGESRGRMASAQEIMEGVPGHDV